MIGRVDELKTLCSFFNGNGKTCLIVGPSGAGKTTMYRTVESITHHIVIDFEYDSNLTHNDNTKIIERSLYSRTILDIMNKKTKVVVFDDVEITISIDRLFHSYLGKLLSYLKKNNAESNKLLVVCSRKEERKISDVINKFDVIIYIDHPTQDECVAHLRTLSLPCNISDENMQKFVLQNSCNIRDINMHLPDLLSEKRSVVYSCKNVDLTIYDLIHKLFGMCNKTYTTHDIDILSSSESTTISHILYDNMLQNIPIKLKKKCTLSDFCSIADLFVNASILENDMYSSNDILCSNLPNTIKCASVVSFYKARNVKVSSKQPNYKFTQVLTKTALAYNIKKKITQLHTSYMSGAVLYMISTQFDPCFPPCLQSKQTDVDSIIKTNSKFLLHFKNLLK